MNTDGHNPQVIFRNQCAAAASTQPTFTIFTPTFNRAHTLPRALASIERQSLRDFDVLIVDDGSTDGTEELIRQWSDAQPFAVTYLQQVNRGKHGAHNTGLPYLRGEFTVLLDSDDALHELGLQRLLDMWHSIPEDERAGFAGVEGLCVVMATGRVQGDRYPQDVMDSDYLTLNQTYDIRGEKRHAIRTDVLRQFPYPYFEGETHVRPSFTWKRMAHHYRFRYFNEVIQLIEHQPGGLSHDRFALRMRNPRGFRADFFEEVNLNHICKRFRPRLRDYSRYARYSFHCGIGPIGQWRDVRSHGMYCLALPSAFWGYLRDLIRIRYRRPRSR